MAAPPITERHLPHFHRRAPVKELCRAATTANITISTALNNGDTLDGVTLATNDRVLVKNQTSPAENGIYLVGASPAREYDESTDDPSYGYMVLVLQGTTNAGTLWQNTNTSAPTIGSTSLTFAAVSGGGGATITTKDEGSTLSSTVTTLDFVGAGVTASGGAATTTITIPGVGSGGATYPLDTYSLNGTYGDDFTAASLSGSWTRRNYTSGAETYQVGKNATFLRISKAGRAVGDGYFRTAPAGDWTFAMKFIPHLFITNTTGWGVGVVDTNGTGVCTVFYTAPRALLVIDVTTYSTYGGTYTQVGAAGNSPNATVMPTNEILEEREIWVYLRKSGTSYFTAFSLDGERWGTESSGRTWAGTVDRVSMMDAPLGTVTSGTGTGSFIDVDWFNKIA